MLKITDLLPIVFFVILTGFIIVVVVYRGKAEVDLLNKVGPNRPLLYRDYKPRQRKADSAWQVVGRLQIASSYASGKNAGTSYTPSPTGYTILTVPSTSGSNTEANATTFATEALARAFYDKDFVAEPANKAYVTNETAVTADVYNL
jgi:hypothetical protein